MMWFCFSRLAAQIIVKRRRFAAVGAPKKGPRTSKKHAMIKVVSGIKSTIQEKKQTVPAIVAVSASCGNRLWWLLLAMTVKTSKRPHGWFQSLQSYVIDSSNTRYDKADGQNQENMYGKESMLLDPNPPPTGFVILALPAKAWCILYSYDVIDYSF